MGIRAKMHELVDELPEEELVELHRAAEARRNRLHAVNGEASFLELAGDAIGSVDGPPDLSTNPKYMAGYGE